MFEFTVHNVNTGEVRILWGNSCDSALRAAGYDPLDWACTHIYDDCEERRVW